MEFYFNKDIQYRTNKIQETCIILIVGTLEDKNDTTNFLKCLRQIETQKYRNMRKKRKET